MNYQDIRLERAIDKAVHNVCMSVKQADCRRHFRRLCSLIKRRRPEVVREMEVQKGLAR